MSKIDYRKIDSDFRPLIKELNRVGLKTTQCCSGHRGKKLAYLSVRMDNIQDLAIRDRGKRFVIWWNRGDQENEQL